MNTADEILHRVTLHAAARETSAVYVHAEGEQGELAQSWDMAAENTFTDLGEALNDAVREGVIGDRVVQTFFVMVGQYASLRAEVAARVEDVRNAERVGDRFTSEESRVHILAGQAEHTWKTLERLLTPLRDKEQR